MFITYPLAFGASAASRLASTASATNVHGGREIVAAIDRNTAAIAQVVRVLYEASNVP